MPIDSTHAMSIHTLRHILLIAETLRFLLWKQFYIYSFYSFISSSSSSLTSELRCCCKRKREEKISDFIFFSYWIWTREKKRRRNILRKKENFFDSLLSVIYKTQQVKIHTIVSAWGVYFNSKENVFIFGRQNLHTYNYDIFEDIFRGWYTYTYSRSWHETHVANLLNEATVSNWNIRIWIYAKR